MQRLFLDLEEVNDYGADEGYRPEFGYEEGTDECDGEE
jgi:hypothetical protein